MLLVNISTVSNIKFSSESKWSRKDDCIEIFQNVSSKKFPFNQFSFHTDLEDSPWAMIDLKSVYPIRKIFILNRLKSHESARTLTIESSIDSDFSSSEILFENNGLTWSEHEVIFNQIQYARFLKFSLRDKNFFHLKQIKIFTDVGAILSNLHINDFCSLEVYISRIANFLGSDFEIFLDPSKLIKFYDKKLQPYYNVFLYIDLSKHEKYPSVGLRIESKDDHNFISVFLKQMAMKYSLDFDITTNNQSLILANELNEQSIDFITSNIIKDIFYQFKIFIYCNSCIRIEESSTPFKNKHVLINSDLVSTVGFADRIRGILSVVKICKNLNLDYSIKFSLPSRLDKYFIFNNYFDRYNPTFFNSTIVYDGLRNRNFLLNDSDEQILNDVIVNSLKSFDCVSICPNFGYFWDSTIFLNCFTRTNFLSSEIIKIKKIIGFNYITLSFRFLGRLGDFDEPGAVSLNKTDRITLLDKCKSSILNFIKEKSIVTNILVLSDSPSFLNYVADIPNVYVFPDNIAHTSVKSTRKLSDELVEICFLKTLVDFCLIMDAECNYLFVTDMLYSSNFPATAARCAGREVVLYEF